METKDEALKLSNQLCFLMYACARATSRYYRPYLDEMGLTYTQFLTMLALWEEKELNVKSLGERLYLDSGTLTPVLKRLEEKGYVLRKRMPSDERQLLICLTEAGEALKDQIYPIYARMESRHPLPPEREQLTRELFREALAGYEAMFEELN